MSEQLGLFDSWVCHARPAALSGRTCGHLNATNNRIRPDRGMIECCEACGCTRKASEDRERREAQA